MQNGILFILVLVFGFSIGGRGDDNIPAGPPWSQVCASLDVESVQSIFASQQCEDVFFSYLAGASVTDGHQWMVAHKSCFDEWAHFSWLAFARNDLKTATLAWRHQLYLAKERLIGDPKCQDENCIAKDVEDLLSKGEHGTIGAEAAAYTNQFLDKIEKDTSYDGPMKEAENAIIPICLDNGSAQCIGAMKQALAWMYPKGLYQEVDGRREHTTFSMIPFVRNVFSDTTTQQYASALALNLLRMIQGDRLPAAGATSIYSLGLAAFNGDIDRFWGFMIVYSTRGPAWATSSKMVTDDNKPVFAAQMVISAAMGYLDTVYGKSGYTFSYLPNTRTTCFQYKPYHYWMAAGFSYLLSQQGYTGRTAQKVARLLGALYELGRDDPDAVFFVPTFDPKVNRVRRELTHHYLGSQLGLTAPPPNQDFDETFLSMVRAAVPLPQMSSDEMKRRIRNPLTKWDLWTRLMGFYFR